MAERCGSGGWERGSVVVGDVWWSGVRGPRSEPKARGQGAGARWAGPEVRGPGSMARATWSEARGLGGGEGTRPEGGSTMGAGGARGGVVRAPRHGSLCLGSGGRGEGGGRRRAWPEGGKGGALQKNK